MKTDLEIIQATRVKVREFGSLMDRETCFHLFWMLTEVECQIRHNKDEDPRKSNRWIGFVHGTLVALTDCTVDELRDICR